MIPRRGRWPAPPTLLVFALSLAGSPLVAKADRSSAAPGGKGPKVAVLPITGSDGTIETSIERALRESSELVRPSDWDAAAERVGIKGRKAADIARVARELGAHVVVTGSVKQDQGAWVLAISVRHGPTGRKSDRLLYPLPGPEVDAPTLQRLVKEIVPAVKKAAEGPPPDASATEGSDERPQASDPVADEPTEAAAPPPPPPPRRAPPRRAPVEDDGEPVDKPAATATPLRSVEVTTPNPPPRRERTGAIRRPVWTPYFDASFGLLVSGRNLTFAPRGQPFFASTIAEGIHLDATVYPLAALATRPGATINAVTGLGLGLTFDDVLWPAAVPCTLDASGHCGPTTERYGVRELRVEGGLRWHWNPLMSPDTFELLASAQYGLHALNMDKRKDGTDVGAPDLSYSYVTLGIGGRLPLAHVIALVARFNYHILVSEGPVLAPSEYGTGNGYGLRVGGGVEATIWRGLVAHLEGFYERFGLSFDGTGTKSATGATDIYYGAIASVGWVEHRGKAQAAPPPPVVEAPRDSDGDGVADDEDRCPAAAGRAEHEGCPDTDGDGLFDADDKCKTQPGPAANGGCPVLDSDGDGVLDKDDDCPAVAGDAASHGCPTYKAVKVTNDRLELTEKIFFAYDRVDILPKSHGILDEIVQALVDHPSLRVKILGHTDAMGSEKHNVELSQGRATAVRDYLVAHGIDAARLEAQGFGSKYPVDSNKTQSGRENNRRVEFLLGKEGAGPAPAKGEAD